MSEPKDTLELLQLNPGLFHSLKYLQDQERKPIKRTFLIGMPRSGTTLWMRLMELACLSRCVGDKHPSYYEGVMKIYWDIVANSGQYLDSLMEGENKDLFCDQYRGYDSKDREKFNFGYALSSLLFANTFRSGYAKSTMIGFSNTMLLEFVEMLREVFAKDDLTICFMVRDIEKAADSMMTFPGVAVNEGDRKHVIEAYEKQLEQMKKARKLGDVWIEYEKFVADPTPFLIRSNPLYKPNAAAVEKIMAKKLRQ